MDFYIHQIGNVYDKYTYERLVCILNSKMIASRDFLEANGMKIVKKILHLNFIFLVAIECFIMMFIFIKTEYRYQILKINM